ncbi:hypothetical protein ABZ532_23420 [Streptomyces sp. NPDC019396]|uniref:hypothetical protein n=1 Tax=Streptomyces sp. NPDC019396 TaxID=3154687 RepID=UPI0033E74C9F
MVNTRLRTLVNAAFVPRRVRLEPFTTDIAHRSPDRVEQHTRGDVITDLAAPPVFRMIWPPTVSGVTKLAGKR